MSNLSTPCCSFLLKRPINILPIFSDCTGVSPRPYGGALWRILTTPPPERFRTLLHTSARTRTPVHLSALIRGFPPASADFLAHARGFPRVYAHVHPRTPMHLRSFSARVHGFPHSSADFRTRPRISRMPADFRARPRISAHVRGFSPRTFPHTSAAFRTRPRTSARVQALNHNLSRPFAHISGTFK